MLRRIIVLAVVMAALAAGAASAAVIGGCVLTCSAPAVSLAQPTAAAPDVATVSGTVNPEGETTAYAFHCTCGTSTGTLDAVTTPQPVSFTVTGLSPGAQIPAYLTASNGAGTTTSPTVTLTTLSPSASPGIPVTLTAGLLASVPVAYADTELELQVQYAGTPGFVDAGDAFADQNGQENFATDETFAALGPYEADGNLRNASFRVQDLGCHSLMDDPQACDPIAPVSVSNTVSDTAAPLTALSWRFAAGRVTLALNSYPVSARYRGPVAYLYVRRGRTWQRAAQASITGASLDPFGDHVAGATFTKVRGDAVAVCVRTPAVADIATAFSFAGCGGRLLPASRPAGSTWTHG